MTDSSLEVADWIERTDQQTQSHSEQDKVAPIQLFELKSQTFTDSPIRIHFIWTANGSAEEQADSQAGTGRLNVKKTNLIRSTQFNGFE